MFYVNLVERILGILSIQSFKMICKTMCENEDEYKKELKTFWKEILLSNSDLKEKEINDLMEELKWDATSAKKILGMHF